MLITILIGSPNAAITGFNSPYDVAVSPNHNYIYVTNNGNNTVSIVDAATNTITETITGFNRPEGIAITPNGAFAYVADLGTNELVRIDTSTNSITEITGGFDLPYYVSISPDGKTAYVTNQGNNTVSVVDLTSQFGLSIPTITPSNAVFDADQNMPFKSTWFGGRPPYAGNWIIFQGSNVVHSTLYTGINTLSNTLSLLASTLGIGNYAANIIVNDGSNAPQTANSVKSTFSINSALNAGNPSPQSPSINGGQSIMLTANPSGGTPQYSYQWYVSQTPTCNSGSITVGTGPSVSVGPSASTYYCYTVTDSATAPATKTSGADLITVTSPIQPNPPSGGGGGGGGGIQRPTIIKIKNGFIVLGIATLNTFNFTLYGIKLNFTTNFISPDSAGITVNNQRYTLYLNNTAIFNQTENPNVTITMLLDNVSLAPILHTITLTVKASPKIIPINVTAQNITREIVTSNVTPTVVNLLGEQTTLNITSSVTANKLLTVRNLTSSLALPALPSGYQKQTIQYVNISPITQNPRIPVNTSIDIQMKYNCTIPYYKIVPFILANYSWKQIASFTVRPNECFVELIVYGDPTLAVTKYLGPGNTTTQTTTMFPTSFTTTIAATTQKSPTSTKELYYFAAIIIAAALVIAAILLYRMNKTKKDKSRNEKEKGRRKTKVSRDMVSKPQKELSSAIKAKRKSSKGAKTKNKSAKRSKTKSKRTKNRKRR